jgi:putative transposase
MDVSARGLRAFRSRPASRKQRSDLVTLAHIKEQSRLSLGSYGRPRMTEELKDIGLNVGHRRVGRLMRQNGISVVRTRKHKATTIARQAIAKQSAERETVITSSTSPRTYWIVTSQRVIQTRSGRALLVTFALQMHCQAMDITYIWTREGWLYLAVILDLHSRRVIGLRVLHAKPFRVIVWAVSNRMKRDL